jgi:hypothetical protein
VGHYCTHRVFSICYLSTSPLVPASNSRHSPSWVHIPLHNNSWLSTHSTLIPTTEPSGVVPEPSLLQVTTSNYLTCVMFAMQTSCSYYDQFILVSGPPLGPMTRFLIYILMSDNCWILEVGHPLWREDGSVVFSAAVSNLSSSPWNGAFINYMPTSSPYLSDLLFGRSKFRTSYRWPDIRMESYRSTLECYI